MPPWVIGDVIWQRQDGAGWSTDPLVVDVGEIVDFRGWFTIANGDEPINAGELLPQRAVSPGFQQSWGNWPGTRRVVNVQPGHGIEAPEIIQWSVLFDPSQIGVWDTRLKLFWDDGPYYSPDHNGAEIAVTVNPRMVPDFHQGDVTAGALEGSVMGKAMAGDVVAHAAVGTVYGRSLTGDVVVNARSGTVGGLPHSGDVVAHDTAGRVDAPVVAGDVVAASRSGTVTAKPNASDVIAHEDDGTVAST